MMAETGMAAAINQRRPDKFTEGAVPLYYYIPAAALSSPNVLVSVHGISRNARQHVRLLQGYAESTGSLVVAPYFSRSDYGDYQRLGYRRSVRRADMALIESLDQLYEKLSVSAEQLTLFGYSGGAQFCHRFAMLHPEKVKALYLGAAGCYTFPDIDVSYPYGVGGVRQIFGRDFPLHDFLKIPTVVLVGERDSRRDHSLNTESRVNAQQGLHRIERARRWVDAVRFFAFKQGIKSDFTLHMIPGCGHSMRAMVRSEVFIQQLKNGTGQKLSSGQEG